MSRIGSFGDLVFSVSDTRIFTPENIKKSKSAKWQTHASVNGEQYTEYIAPEADEIKMPVLVSASLGVKPGRMLTVIEDLVKEGRVDYLIIGGKRISEGKMRLVEAGEAWNEFFVHGELYEASVDLTFKEYS